MNIQLNGHAMLMMQFTFGWSLSYLDLSFYIKNAFETHDCYD